MEGNYFMKEKLMELKKVSWVSPVDAWKSFIGVTLFTAFMTLFVYGIDILSALISKNLF